MVTERNPNRQTKRGNDEMQTDLLTWISYLTILHLIYLVWKEVDGDMLKLQELLRRRIDQVMASEK